MIEHNRIVVLGVTIDRLSFDQVIAAVVKMTQQNTVSYVVTANPEMVVAAQKNPDFCRAINNADLVVPDGIGLLPAAEFLHSSQSKSWLPIRTLAMVYQIGKVLFRPKSFTVLPSRITGADLVVAVAEKLASEDAKIFLLGGAADEANKAKAYLENRFPKLRVIADAGNATVDKESDAEFACVANTIQASGASAVFIAYGHPKQELWIAKHVNELPPAVYMGVGGTFSYLSGSKKRASHQMQKLGLEWLWRLIIEPTRLLRILTAVVIFPYYVIFKSS